MSGSIAALLAGGAAAGGGLTASASPPALNSGSNGATFTTAATTVIISGGVGPFTKAWSLIFQDGVHTFSINAPTAATTGFNIGSISDGDACYATAECIVSDTAGGGTATITVDISHQNTRGFRGTP